MLPALLNPTAAPLLPVHYSLICEPDIDWTVRRMRLEEALSRPYLLTVDVSSPSAELDLDAMLGKSFAFVIDRQAISRQVCGVVSAIERGDPEDDQVPLRITIVPAVQLLAQRWDTRLWRDRSIIDIVEEVLGAWLRRFQRRLDTSHLVDTYPPREYVVQYDESDLAFVQRLLEAEGVSYHFDHETDEGREVMVLEDSADHRAEVLTMDDESGLWVVPDRHELQLTETLQTLSTTRRRRPERAVCRAVSWRDPDHPLRAETGEGLTSASREIEVYRHGSAVERAPERHAALELSRARHDASVFEGRSNLTCLEPGGRFCVQDDTRPEFGRELLVIRVTHEGEASPDQLGASYTNTFQSVPFIGVWRPPLSTPRPKIYGPQTARVTGPEGEEIHTDALGRVKVRFDWDREHALDDDTSMWIRVAQSWAGGGFGAQFIPRVGMEVVVEFLDGDPDRPLVTGAVYNGARGPALGLPGTKTQTSLRTQSTPGGAGFNELRFEDAAGSEQVFIHAQRDLEGKVLHDARWTVGRDRCDAVGRDRNTSVGRDETTTIGGNRSATIEADESISVRGDRSTLIEGEDHRSVVGHATSLHESGLETRVRGVQAAHVLRGKGKEGVASLEVQGSATVDVDNEVRVRAGNRIYASQGGPGAPTASVTFEGGSLVTTVDRQARVVAGETATWSSKKAVAITGGETVEVSQGAASISLEHGEVEIVATKITLVVGGNSLTISDSGVRWQAASFTLEASGDVGIEGASVSID